MENLVTVTCNRDKAQMLLQAESIHRFLERCTHWVIINEPDVDLNEWRSLLSPYYTTHELKLVAPLVEYKNLVGYFSQMIYKFWIYVLIKDDYLVLDPKNFFVNYCSINDWENQEGSGHWWDLSENDTFGISKIIDKYSSDLDIKPDYTQLAPFTPFVLRKDILEYINNNCDYVSMLSGPHEGVIPSEFIYYSILMKHLSPHRINEYETRFHHRLYAGEIEWNGTFEFSDVKMVGIHRNFFKCHDVSRLLNDALKSYGFNTQFSDNDISLLTSYKWFTPPDIENPDYPQYKLLNQLNEKPQSRS